MAIHRMIDHLFVYGTLLSRASSPMHHLLRSQARLVVEGHTQGLLYEVSHYPGLVVSDDAGHRVTGEIYELHDTETVLDGLDRYEGCHASSPRPHPYVREAADIITAEGNVMTAWVYFYVLDTTGLRSIPSGDFLQHIS